MTDVTKIEELTEEETQRIQTRDLNDLARTAMGIASRLTATRNLVEILSSKAMSGLREAVEKYDVFEAENDPYGTHDFGTLYGHIIDDETVEWKMEEPVSKDAERFSGHTVFWKIDIYSDKTYQFGSEEPWNVQKSARVLTLMLASDY